MKNRAKPALALALAIVGAVAAPLRSDARSGSCNCGESRQPLAKQAFRGACPQIFVLYPGRSDHSYDYETIIKEENIGAIPLLPTSYQRNADGTVKLASDGKTKLFDGKDGEAALRKFIADILGRKTNVDHLGNGRALPTRGTSVVVGKGFSRDTIPTIELTGTEWPTFKDENSHYIEIPIAKVNAMPTTLPSLVCLKAPSKPAIIVNVLEVHVKPTPTSHGVYKIEWVPSLSE